MASVTNRRLLKDRKKVEDSITGAELEDKCEFYESDGSLTKWKGYLIGEENGLYSGGKFEFELSFLPEYPFKGPQFKFTNPGCLYHPGVSKEGTVCLEVLNHWNPSNNPLQVLMAVWNILNEPDLALMTETPLRPELASELNDTPGLFKAKVKLCIARNGGATLALDY